MCCEEGEFLTASPKARCLELYKLPAVGNLTLHYSHYSFVGITGRNSQTEPDDYLFIWTCLEDKTCYTWVGSTCLFEWLLD